MNSDTIRLDQTTMKLNCQGKYGFEVKVK